MQNPDPVRLIRPIYLARPIYLTRSDAARNMARFYGVCVQPTLFGEVALLRHWGRIGTRGQSLMQTFADAEAAALAQDRLVRSKRRRGYGA